MGADYFKSIDNLSSQPQYFADTPAPQREGKEPDDGLNFTAKSIGANTDPFGNTLDSLKARIREGTARVEFNFLQQGKGNAQQPTPEMFGSKERRDMRELLKANKMKGSVHAPVTSDSLAGFDPQSGGFSDQKRGKVLKEIKRAIDFASEASTGGAVVFHMHEWQRPVSELKRKYDDTLDFKEYEGQEGEALKYVVDQRNGQVIRGSAIKPNQPVYRPEYETASDRGMEGKTVPVLGGNGSRTLQPGDWVDVDGNYIPPNADAETLFKRVPKFNEENTSFKSEKVTWEDLVEETREYNKRFGEDLEPEERYAQYQLENQILQSRGQSLMYGRQYKGEKKRYQRLKSQWDRYQDLKEEVDDPEKLKPVLDRLVQGNGETMSVEEKETAFKDQLKRAKDSLTHIHQASGSSDVQAQEFQEQLENLTTVEEYGSKRTAETIANAADYAMQMYEKRKDKNDLEDPLYVAPENWSHEHYGSHPEEYKEIISKSREQFTQNLKQRGYSEQEARQRAEQHIKGTLDIGHMNTFRYRFVNRRDGEDIEDYEERFNEWLLNETKDLVEEGYVGHIHLNDNMGYEDEHLTPGEGKVPMKKFLKNMEELGMDDLIVEQGSFNGQAHIETLNLTNSPVYGMSRRPRQNQVRRGHFGYRNPGMFVAGSYAPSNDFTLWTDTPLE